MTYDSELLYWRSNKEWYEIVGGKFVLTDKAPERAKESFKLANKTPEKL